MFYFSAHFRDPGTIDAVAGSKEYEKALESGKPRGGPSLGRSHILRGLLARYAGRRDCASHRSGATHTHTVAAPS